MNNFFTYNSQTGSVELDNSDILLVKEFAKLIEHDRNKCKEDPTGECLLRAFKEFTYIQLAICWKSPYSDNEEQVRHQYALQDSGLTEEEFNDPDFRAACRKYRSIQDSNRSIRLLQAAQTTADNLMDYFNTIVDFGLRKEDGTPIYKTKDVIAEISSLHKVHEELTILESQVKKELSETSSIRGGAVDGFLPNFNVYGND